MKRVVVFLLFPLLLTSCAHVLSEKYVQSATTGVSYKQIKDDPEAYIGKTFILGGTIVDTTDTKEGSEVEVIENPVDKYGNITDPDISDGRYLIETMRQLDPLIYRKGRHLTFAGKLVGSRKETLDEMEYRYLVFQAEQIYLWRAIRHYPHPYHYYSSPFFSPYPYYFYDPFWYGAYYYPWP